MPGYKGKAESDRYAGYESVYDDSVRQVCWSHESRNAEEGSCRPDAGEDARRLLAEMRRVYGRSKRLLEFLPPSRRLRSAMEAEMSDVLDRFRGSDCEAARRMVARLDRSMPMLFLFMEDGEVDPANDASERALRLMSRFRKVCMQLKGGRVSMVRLGHFATCVASWEAQGRSVYDEIRRAVVARRR